MYAVAVWLCDWLRLRTKSQCDCLDRGSLTEWCHCGGTVGEPCHCGKTMFIVAMVIRWCRSDDTEVTVGRTVVIVAPPWALRCQCRATAVPLTCYARLRCHCSGTEMPLPCHCDATDVPLPSQCGAIDVPLRCHYDATDVPLPSHCDATAEPLTCHCRATAVPLRCHCG